MDIIVSFIIYFFVYINSIMLISAYQKHNQGKKHNYVLLFFIAMLLPIILGGFRSVSVGTDSDTYTKIFSNCKNLTFKQFLFYKNDINYVSEVGFYFLFRFVGLFTDNYKISFLVEQILTIGFLFGALYRQKKYIDLRYALFVYYMVFYQSSFNIVRQMLAISIILLALSYLLEKRTLFFVLWVVIASLFHTSAIICLIFGTVRGVELLKNIDKKTRRIIIILIIPVIIITVNNIIPIVNFFQNQGFFKTYINKYGEIAGSFSFNDFLLYLPPILISLFVWKKLRISQYRYMLYISLLQFPILMLAARYRWIYRIALYPAIAQVFLMGYVAKLPGRNKTIIKNSISIWYLVFYALYYFVFGINETFPYKLM